MATKEEILVYEELRLLRKHTAWSLMHLNRLCELFKPDDEPDAEPVDENQTEIIFTYPEEPEEDKPDQQ